MVPSSYHSLNFLAKSKHLFLLLTMAIFTLGSVHAEHYSNRSFATLNCEANAGALGAAQICLQGDQASIQASPNGMAVIPDGFQVIYVLTSGDELIINDVSNSPKFIVDATGTYTIHTLVYDPSTLDLGIVEFGVTTGFDVNGLLEQGGGDICASLDVPGSKFSFDACEAAFCLADAGSLAANDACLEENIANLTATITQQPTVPENFEVIYVLTSGEGLVIENVNASPTFDVDSEGRFTIHTLVYDPTTLDLGIVEIGVTTGVDVNNLLIQGGGDICAALDVAGAPFDVAACEEACLATAGTLVADDACLDDGIATLTASEEDAPNVPEGFEIIYVLTSGEGLVIENVNASPTFDVDSEGRFTIHTLVYDPTTLDLGIVEIGVTTGVDVNNLLIQGGGDICAALDVAGAPFDVAACEEACLATAGTLVADDACLDDGMATLTASEEDAPNVPEGFEIIYVLTSGEGLVIENVNASPTFDVDSEGRFTIHTLVYDPTTLDLGIVEIGVTTGVDVNNLLIQGGGDICAALDVAGAPFDVVACEDICLASAGSLISSDACLKEGTATLEATINETPNVPEGYEVIYVLTSGEGLVIENVNTDPSFEVDSEGRFTIHTLVYDPATLDLGIVEIGVTTGVDVNNLLIQGGGDICAALDVAGAPFDLESCVIVPCLATAGTLEKEFDSCFKDGEAYLEAKEDEAPNVPAGYEILYVLTKGVDLVIIDVNTEPVFFAPSAGQFRVHTLVYDPNTLDLSIVRPGITTGFDVNALLVQGGGDICAALDVAGAQFHIADCPCVASAGSLRSNDFNCIVDESTTISASVTTSPIVPGGFETLYVLTTTDRLIIIDVATTPSFTVTNPGLYTIHTLVYDPSTLDLGIVSLGETTGFDVNGLLIQGGGDICAALDVAGAKFEVEGCPCEADAGALEGHDTCLDGTATLVAQPTTAPTVPNGYQVIYVLTSGEGLVIEAVNGTPEFEVAATGTYTIHTLVYDPNTLDLGIVQFGQTTGFDVNGLLIQGGGDICAALDVAGAPFHIDECPCEADAGALEGHDTCLDGTATLVAQPTTAPTVPNGYQVIYVLTSGEGLVIEAVNGTPEFEVAATGTYTIHTLVYDPNTLDLGIVQFGQTTGFDVNGLLIQGGGDICAALDVAGAPFHIDECPCEADAGALEGHDTCLDGTATLVAQPTTAPTVPNGYQVIYVLTSGEGLVIEAVNGTPEFEVAATGTYTIHTLVYDPNTLDLGIVQFGQTTGFDVNGLLIQGGGDICAALDVAGAPFHIDECPCEADAGALEGHDTCLDGTATLVAQPTTAPTVPNGYQVIYVLTSGEGLVIEAVNGTPEFEVAATGTYTIHTLVYDPNTLDLGIVQFGQTTGFDVNGLLIQGGGDICAALDVAGAPFHIDECPCEADAGALEGHDTCLDGTATLVAQPTTAPTVPNGYQVIYVLTSGEGLVIEAVNGTPEFEVAATGTYTIHTLVYDPNTLDLGIVQFGQTTGFDVNGLLIQGGGDICAALDVAGAPFHIDECPCEADAGALEGHDTCLDGTATLVAQPTTAPTVPNGYQVIYVLTSGEGLVIEAVNGTPEFEVAATGTYTIHTLVYDPNTLDLGIVQFGQTTGFDVNGLLIQGGGDICAALDVAGAPFHIDECPCEADAGALEGHDTCLDGTATLVAQPTTAPTVPNGYQVIYVLTSGEGLVIEAVNGTPEFEVAATGTYTIHTLVYDPNTLDLGIVQFGQTTGFDVNGLLIQGGGDICAALDVAGAPFHIDNCNCEATAGTLTQDNHPCLEDGAATIIAKPTMHPVVPGGYEVLYVLTSGEGLVIEGVNTTPEFEVNSEGLFTIHTLVYNPSTLDLSIVSIGQTTGFDVNGLLVQGGGNICAALDVAGAPFQIEICPCPAEAGTLTPTHEGCLENGLGLLQAAPVAHPVVPMDFEVIYVLTSGEGLVIEAVNNKPEFEVTKEGRFTIHTLVYNPNTLDLGIVEFGVTTGVDVNGLLTQGGGQICGALDVAGAPFHVAICPCDATAGTLDAVDDEPCVSNGVATLKATIDDMPHVPEGFEVLYVLTSGEGLIIEAVNTAPEFDVHGSGEYTIHTLVYDPNTLDLSIVVLGETTGFDVNGLLIQGGGFICAALDVPGAKFEVEACDDVNGLGLSPNPTTGQIELDFQDAGLVNKIEVQFFDMNGRLLNNRVFEGGRQKQSIDVSNLPGGVYNVQVWYDGEPAKIRKLLKR